MKPYTKAAFPLCLLAGAIAICVLLSGDANRPAPPDSGKGANGAQSIGGSSDRDSAYTPPDTTNPRLSTLVDRESQVPRVTGDIATRIPRATDPRDIEAVPLPEIMARK